MKLWRISQDVNNGWDTYDSAVVAAETEEEARNTFPDKWDNDPKVWNGHAWMWHLEDGQILHYSGSSWTSPGSVSVEFLSDGYEGPAGVIVASFNAG